MHFPPSHHGKSGFTLIELMVVLILIGIVTAVVLPEMRGTYEDALLRSTSRKIISVCNLAASRAVTVNRDQRVTFDSINGEYQLLEKGAREPIEKGELDKRISVLIRNTDIPREEAEEPQEVDALRKRMDGEALKFYPDGTADPKEVLLRDRQGFELTLRLNSATGKFRIIEGQQE